MKRIINIPKSLYILSALPLLLFYCSGCGSNNISSYYDDYLLDTAVNIKTSAGDDCCNEMSEYLEYLDKNLSSVYSDSTKENKSYKTIVNDILKKTSALNSVYGDSVNISCGALNKLWGISTDSPHIPDTAEIEKALHSMVDTDYCKGDIDKFPVGVSVDVGAVAKGYACDNILNILNDKYSYGYTIADMGSSTILYGKKPDESKFNVAVRNPDGGDYLGTLKTDECFISSSGGYERFFESDNVKYSHILDTTTGYPVNSDITSVTVIVPLTEVNGGIKSDFLATMIYIDGMNNINKYLDDESFYVIVADCNKKIYYSNGIDFILNNESGYSID